MFLTNNFICKPRRTLRYTKKNSGKSPLERGTTLAVGGVLLLLPEALKK